MAGISNATGSSQSVPELQGVDHIHLFVPDRTQAEKWYEAVLGFRRIKKLEGWAVEDGPLTIADAGGNAHLALFERDLQHNRATIALRTNGEGLLRWQAHLKEALGRNVELVDHELSWSIYFSDPYGNPFEITSYDYTWIHTQLNQAAGKSRV